MTKSSESETIEIDPDNLSEEVASELENKGIESEEAEDFGEEAWFEEVDKNEPNKRGIKEHLLDKARNTKKRFSDYINKFSRKSVYREVISSEKTENDKIRVKVEQKDFEKEIYTDLEVDGVLMSNILEWKNIDNHKELIGEKVPVKINRDGNKRNEGKFMFPNNVSPFGKTRFWLYCNTKNISEKTKINKLEIDGIEDEKMINYIFFNGFTFSIFAFVFTINNILSEIAGNAIYHSLNMNILFPVAAIIFGSQILYHLYRFSIKLFLRLIKGDVEEIDII